MHIAILCISAVAICTERVEAKCNSKVKFWYGCVAICTERVEAKVSMHGRCLKQLMLQSARSVWRQRQFRKFFAIYTGCNLHGACGGKGYYVEGGKIIYGLQSARSVWRQRASSSGNSGDSGRLQSARSVWRQRLCEAGFRYSLPLQSARSVWRQRCTSISSVLLINRCNLHGACGGKDADISLHFSFPRCNLHGACGGKVVLLGAYNTFYTLQSARGVWKTLHHPPEKNPRKFMQTYCIFIHLAV